MLSFDAPQWLAVGLAVLSAPVLVLVHGWLRRVSWGLPAAAAAHATTWLVLCSLQDFAALAAADWVAGGALLGALWLGWFQVYSVLCRGFSLQLMVEIERRPQRLDELASGYADGRGIGWLLDKRLRGLRSAGLLQATAVDPARAGRASEEPARVESTPAGRRLARVARLYKRLAGIGAGG